MPGPIINKPVPGAREFIPLNEPPIGTPLEGSEVELFKPLTIRGVTFKNRIWVSPMCQYSANHENGTPTDWHFVHIGGFATRGVGAIVMEAASVVPEGRISPEDLGIWSDESIAPLKRIVDFVHSQGTKIGIQLAHAGRKASTYAPWLKEKAGHGASWVAKADEHGWPDKVYGPGDIPYSKTYPEPKTMAEEDLKYVEDAFVTAARRCETIGFDFIELHAAHGYLMHEFVSPLSNNRTDQYGGSLENRLRYPTRIIESVRAAWKDKPLFVRISATDWAEGPEKSEDGTWLQWGLEQSNAWVDKLVSSGAIDLLDVSTSGNWEKQKITLGHGYQVPFAEAIKKAHPELLVGTVGLISDPVLAEGYLKDGKADVIFLARELMRNPHWAAYAAQKLGVKVKVANQYERLGLW